MAFNRYNLFHKIISLFFTFLVIGTVLVLGSKRYINLNRDFLWYVAIMVMITLVYLELLVIRDHLWVLEGSLREARRWREIFFSKHSLKQLRIRKLFVVITATILFTVVYIFNKETGLFSFLGIILMVTVLYFEVLAIRDDLKALSFDLKARQIADMARDENGPQAGPDQEEGGLAPKDDEV